MTILTQVLDQLVASWRTLHGRVAAKLRGSADVRGVVDGLLVGGLLAGLVSALLVPRLAGQAAETQAPVPVLKLSARTVLVDVVVTGKHGKPVTGLHKEDFQVLEDGSPQTITSFEEHGEALPDERDQTKPASISTANVFTNVSHVESNGSLLILLVDSLNTPAADQSRVRKTVLQYLQKVPAGRPIAIFTLGSELRCIQGITGDPAVLNALANDARNGIRVDPAMMLASKTQAVEDKTAVAQLVAAGQAGVTGPIDTFQKTQTTSQEAERKLKTLDAFLQLAHSLAGVPGRKSVAWFSGSFPHLTVSSSEALELFDAQRNYSEQARATEAALVAARVAIYPIAATGLETGSFFESDTQLTSHKPMDAQGETHDMLSADGKVHNDNQASMDGIAQATGGEAIYNTNDLNGALERVADDGSHYYTLFYVPSSTTAPAQYRKITVKVPAGHYKLAYNLGYYGGSYGKSREDGKVAAGEGAPDPLGPYMKPGTLDSTQIPFYLQVSSTRAVSQNEASQGNGGSGAGCAAGQLGTTHPYQCYSVDFNIGASGLEFDRSEDGLQQDSLELTLLVSDKNGKVLNGSMSKVNYKLDGLRYRYVLTHGAHLQLSLAVPADGFELRGGVYDRNSGRAGTLTVPLASVVAVAEPAALEKVAASTEAVPDKTGPDEAARSERVDPLAEAAGASTSEEKAVVVPLPRPADEADPAIVPIATEKPGSASVFWTLPPKVVQGMLTSAPSSNEERYARLRAYFRRFGCGGSHLSGAQPQKETGGNLICMLPGTDERTIVVASHFEHRGTADADAQSWSSAIMLARLYKALQAQPRHYSFVFVELCDEPGEKQFLNSLASANLRSLAGVVALDAGSSGPLDYKLSQAEPRANMQSLITEDELLRRKAVQNGEQTKQVLGSTLIKAAQVNKLTQPIQLEPSRGIDFSQVFSRSTYIPSILIYAPSNAGKSRDAGAVGPVVPDEAVFDLLGTYLSSLDANLAER